jgi:hypothetical protein
VKNWPNLGPILKIFSPKIFAKKLAFLTQNKAKLWKQLIITLVFKKTPIFCQKFGKVAENYDHNIDPRSPWLPVPVVANE